MALDSEGARKRTVFFTDTQSIWCDVDYSSGRKDVTFDAEIRAVRLWSDAAAAFVPVDVVQAFGETVGQQGTGNTAGFEWLLQDATGSAVAAGSEPYPVGDFRCDLRLDGDLVASLPFSIDFPMCPLVPVVAGVACAGWVREGSLCPDATGGACACSMGVWTC
jgi:hypothetical protein